MVRAVMEPSYLYGLLGGCAIGLASLLAMAATGKVPGISGIFGRVLRPKKNDVAWRVLFLVSLIAGAALTVGLVDHAALFQVPEGRNGLVLVIAGLLVGFGTRLGGGCTSGHGVCGMGMGARDSIVATLVFMASGALTVFVFKWLPGLNLPS